MNEAVFFSILRTGQEGPAQARFAINKMYLKDVRASQ